MKQLEPTSADVFMTEHKVGDELMGRIVDAHGSSAKVELSEGVHGRCKAKEETASASTGTQASGSVDDLAAMLASRWKSGTSSSSGSKDTMRAGQIRKFRITSMDSESKRIEVELAD
jgi:ribosomal protein S1